MLHRLVSVALVYNTVVAGWLMLLDDVGTTQTSQALSGPHMSIELRRNGSLVSTFVLRGRSADSASIDLLTETGRRERRIVHYDGGFEQMIRDLFHGFESVPALPPRATSAPARSMMIEITIEIRRNAVATRIDLRGDSADVYSMIYASKALERLFGALSEGWPKKYRIINPPGPLKAVVPNDE